MKKILSIVLAIVVCLSLVGIVAAAGDAFVPSITYKGQPEVTAVEGADGDGCLRIVPVAEADQLPEADRELLLKVYNELNDGTMTPPTEGTIRELLDVALCCDHDHAKQFAAGEIAITVTFDLGVEGDAAISAHSYVEVDGEYKWVEAESVVNNGDGTVSVTFKKLCPVAISVA